MPARPKLGELSQLIPFPGDPSKTKYVVYAASVFNDATTREAIESIARSLGEITRSHQDIRLVEAPLLGTGAGRLSAEDSITSLAKGFQASGAAEAQLLVFAFAETYKVMAAALEPTGRRSRQKLGAFGSGGAMRDDFPIRVKELLAKRVAQRCSNPGCRRPTSGPQDDSGGAINIGVAAHLTAASPNGPRFDAARTASQRSAPDNGIWLCQSCAKLIDSDQSRYALPDLRAWKTEAERIAATDLEQMAGGPTGGRMPPDAVEDLSLFDRRYEIYQAVAEFLAGAIQLGAVERGREIEFLRQTKQAHFFFGGDPDIEALLKDIYERATRLQTLQAKERSLRGHLLEINVDEQTDVKMWFQETLMSLQSRFDKYLRPGSSSGTPPNFSVQRAPRRRR